MLGAAIYPRSGRCTLSIVEIAMADSRVAAGTARAPHSGDGFRGALCEADSSAISNEHCLEALA